MTSLHHGEKQSDTVSETTHKSLSIFKENNRESLKSTITELLIYCHKSGRNWKNIFLNCEEIVSYEIMIKIKFNIDHEITIISGF